jgi:ribosomal protein S18 acetylase RimI-like enzyme
LVRRHIFREFIADGNEVILRRMSWNDLDKLLVFVNGLVDDKRSGRGSHVFTGFERKITRREERDYLAHQMEAIQKGRTVSVIAEVNDRIVGNGNIDKGNYSETQHHGHLGLTVLAEYRGIGIGREMVKVLLREAKKIGVKNVDVEFLAINQAAIRTYQKAGFREVGGIPGKVHRRGKLLESMVMAREI